MNNYILHFRKITNDQVAVVGGKNASLGEMVRNLEKSGIKVPPGYAVKAKAYREFIKDNNLRVRLSEILARLDTDNFENLKEVGRQARALLDGGLIPYKVQIAILAGFEQLKDEAGEDIQLAVRSSATAEDLPEASFAGQQESFLNISDPDSLLEACRQCYVSLFTDRAIKYRVDQGFDHMDVALSIGVQVMVRSDKASAGVCFTIDPDSGFKDVVVINGAWGLGENVVKGSVDPDEFIVYKPNLRAGRKSILAKKVGAKQQWMRYFDTSLSGTLATTINEPTPEEKRKQFVLDEKEILELAKWCLIIEEHYQCPMDIEWAKDGISGQLFIVQARPETVHALKDHNQLRVYHLHGSAKAVTLTQGIGLGHKITAGVARVLKDPSESDRLQDDEVLVADTTNPDWDPLLKKAAAIVTNKGGRTSHAAIVARELGAVAVVGAGDATEQISDGQLVTVSTAQGSTGYVYDGKLKWEEQGIDVDTIKRPKRTQVMLILGDPDQAFQYATLPTDGIGLMRMEFIINNSIRIHPMALVNYKQLTDTRIKAEIDRLTYNYPDKPEYFIDQLSQSVGLIAAAFYPRPVIVRMSDFKSNEYANLIGGQLFEPKEENPMLGFRGASRYDHDLYREGFRLECLAMKRVREEMGFDNVKLMIPFCRTPEEGGRVVQLMKSFGLQQGKNGLEIYTMVEIPSNVVLAKSFADIFDGFSIGSNDLTQLTLGLDRDNALISDLFDEKNEAVKTMIRKVVEVSKIEGVPIGFCGQAPSDFPEFAGFLTNLGMDSISFNADALLKGVENIVKAEGEGEVVLTEVS